MEWRKGIVMSKENCWEYKNCGREPGGKKVRELGVCPAATVIEAHGFLGGQNGGRACMYVTGTFCGGFVQGTHRDKKKHCEDCDFYQLLKKEHRGEVSLLKFKKHCDESKAEAS